MRTLLLFLVLASIRVHAQGLLPEQLRLLEGTWRGELMYINYGDGTEARIPADLLVLPAGPRSWAMGFGYADEPHANDRDTLVLNAAGDRFGGQQVMAVERPAADSLRLVLEEDADDDNAPARIRRTWTIGASTCTLRKEVRPAAMPQAPFMLRHEYRLRRVE